MSGRARTLTLVAMTLANSMILIDQTAVPLATPRIMDSLGGSISTGQWVLIASVLPLGALMVFGGRLGDLLGLRRVFLAGALLFIVSSALVGAAPNVAGLIAMRVSQGIGAALMMPTTLAIVGAVYGEGERGRALGLMAGASAFFAALGPVLGGALTEYVGWRSVFWVNVPLALITVILTLANTPEVKRPRGEAVPFDVLGLIAFVGGVCGLTVGLGQGETWGWTSPLVLVSLAVGVAGLIAFVRIDRHRSDPLMDLSLFRLRTFTASNVSQLTVGAIALVAAFLLPYYLLLVVGIGPAAAGLALLPSTVPIILVAPVAGKWFDKAGGASPLLLGYGVLAASGLALGAGVGAESVLGIVPGLVLLGVGLGIVQTANDPLGLAEVPDRSQGQASGVIQTSEQLGGAVGLALFLTVFLTYLHARFYDLVATRGMKFTAQDTRAGVDFVMTAEQQGLHQVRPPPGVANLYPEFSASHVDAYRLIFVLLGAFALVAGVVCVRLLRATATDRSARVST